jgi:hypothetical protein
MYLNGVSSVCRIIRMRAPANLRIPQICYVLHKRELFFFVCESSPRFFRLNTSKFQVPTALEPVGAFPPSQHETPTFKPATPAQGPRPLDPQQATQTSRTMITGDQRKPVLVLLIRGLRKPDHLVGLEYRCSLDL